MILSFILLSFTSVILLLKNNTLYVGWDSQFNFKRIMELKQSFNNGIYLPNFSFNELHGSSVMILYPYFNLIPAVLLSYIVGSKIVIIYLFFMFNIFMIFIISFYASKDYIKHVTTAYIFSIIYGLSIIFLYNAVISSDFGILSSYMFLPLIIFGFLNIIQEEKNRWIELSLGMCLLLFSHILNVIIIGLFLLLMLIINYKIINKYIIIDLIKSILLFIVITSIVWMPFLSLYLSNFNGINMPFINQLEGVKITDFVSGLYGSKTNSTIGFFPIIAMFISLPFFNNFNFYIKQLYLLSLIIIFSVLFLPWKIITSYGIFKFLNQLQFTSRFLIIPLMLLSFIFSLIITQYIRNSYKRKIIYFVTIFMTVLIQLIAGQYLIINKLSNNPSISNYVNQKGYFIDIGESFGYTINNSHQFNVLLNTYYGEDDDYIPKLALSMSSYVNRDLGLYNNQYQIKINHVGYNTFNFIGKDNINKLSLPIYAYNREKLRVYLNDKPVNNYANNGLLTIDDIKDNIKPNNEIYIKPTLSPFRIIGAILSILGWLFILIIFIKRKFFNFLKTK